MKDLESIVRQNEELAEKFFQLEISILAIRDFKGLLERLLSEIMDKFGVPYAWLTLVSDTEILAMVRDLSDSPVLGNRLRIMNKQEFLNLVEAYAPILSNVGIDRFAPLFPEGPDIPAKSLAVVPISLEGAIAGSLNLADDDPERYTPNKDPKFLARLGVKVSLCLANVLAHEKLHRLATRDPLTGLLNRRAITNVIQREFARSRRYDTPLTLAFLDLDEFKTVNDRYGHDCGDELLVLFSKRLLSEVRSTDTVGRLAGDEFLLLLPEVEKQGALAMLSRLRRFFEDNPIPFENDLVQIKFSYGLAQVGDPGVTGPESLICEADKALYRSKKAKV